MPSRVAVVSFAVLVLACSPSPEADTGVAADAPRVDAETSDVPSDDAPTGVDAGDVDGGTSSSGFVAEPGFVVTGTFAHGGEVTIRRTGGGFGTRELPWLFDTVDHQYVAGADMNAYAGLTDGEPIRDTVWTWLGIYAGWDGEREHRFRYTTDAARLRHPRAVAQYGNYARSPTDPRPYSRLSEPVWPAAWGPQRNEQMYLSWWQRMNGASPGYPQDDMGNGGEDKPLRFGSTSGRGLGEFDITVAGLTATTVGHGNVKSWGSFPNPGAAWHRIEFFVDRTQGIADMWVDGNLSIGSWSGAGGAFEFRPADRYLYVSPPRDGMALATSDWENVTVHWLGFDDGGTTQMFAPGRNVEISEVYLDVTRSRFELSDASTWNDRPDANRTSEVQGPLLSFSDDEVRLVLRQGAFDALAGLGLWWIDDDGEARLVGRIAGM